jgi:hypothetical protein
MTARARTTVEGTRLLHRELWRVVGRQLDQGVAQPRGAFYEDLVAMVFALHTLEAYLNYVGELLAPQIWANERKYFSKNPFRGFDGKVRKVLELVGLPEPDRDLRPYSTVWSLKDLRDTIAHARPERFSGTYEHPGDADMPFQTTPLDSVATRANAEMARLDITQFIEAIHTAAKPRVTDVWFGSVALEGPRQYSRARKTNAA